MATYAWQGDVLTITFTLADDGADHVHVVKASDLSQTVRDAAMRFGLQTVLRNATAGKMDEIQDAIKAQAARMATLSGGKWAEQKQAKDAVALDDDEKQDIIAREVVNAYMMKPGNTKTRQQVLDWFNGQDETMQQTVLSALKAPIDKALKTALAARKKAGKTASTLPDLM